MSGNAFVSYYLAPILSSVGLTSDLNQTLVNATMQMLSWFSAMYFATLPKKFVQRVLFLWSLVFMWLIDIAITAGSAMFKKDNTNQAAGYSVVALLYLLSPAYNLGLNGNLGLYIPEILPFRLRTRGLAIFYFTQFGFMILSTFAVPVVWRTSNGDCTSYLLPGSWWSLLESTLLFPETKGPSLEDIAIIFDGPKGKDIEGDVNHVETALVGK